MIVATAGHIDHGKTRLIHALTGVDTDRLPEEKQRDMTIDLGFAYRPLSADRSIAFIDVPGHERFIRNMLCGVAGVDFVILVVAADDGIMPQTREHLAVLDLLEIRRGLVAITKTDRVDAGRVASVVADVRTLIAGTTLAGVPVLSVSSATGTGMDAMEAQIVEAGEAWRLRDPSGNFRLAVDRCFHIRGAGLVVTGTAFAGTAAVGDALWIEGTGAAVRLRGMHVNNQPATRCQSGQRCALNIVGPAATKESVKRGDWIVADNNSKGMRRLDTNLRVLAGEARELRHWTPVHVHLGAAETTGRVAILEGKVLAPGRSDLAQLHLDDPVGAQYGDRFIIRDQSAQRTIGGGHVVDIYPPARGRAKPARLAALRAIDQADPEAALGALLEVAADGVRLGMFQRARNLTDDEVVALTKSVSHHRVEGRGGVRLFSPARWQGLTNVALSNLANAQSRASEERGVPEAKLLGREDVAEPADVSVAIAAALQSDGIAVREGRVVWLPGHKTLVTSATDMLWARVKDILVASGTAPPTVSELATEVDADIRQIDTVLHARARQRHVFRIGPKRFFAPSALRELGAIVEALAAEGPDGQFGVRAFRDRAGVGRNVAIEILEYFDSVRFTRRIGNEREITRPLADVLPTEDDDV